MKKQIFYLLILFSTNVFSGPGKGLKTENSINDVSKSFEEVIKRITEEEDFKRELFGDISKTYGTESVEMKKFFKALKEKDSLNTAIVTQLLDKYGWPGYSVIGITGNQVLYGVLRKADLKTQEKYLSELKKAVIKGDANPRNFAMMQDNISLRKSGKQIYGTQFFYNSTDGINELFPIDDEFSVNSRRTTIGLEPIEDFLKLWNIGSNPKGKSEQESRF